MRTLLVLLPLAALLAQPPAPPAAPAALASEAAATPAAPAADAGAAAAAEQPVSFSTDLGYRFLTGEHGSWNTYRSVNNLGEGPRLLGFEGTIRPPGHRLFDTLRVNGANWGDPMNSAHLIVDKESLYRFTFSYRNLAYFNALPSFANPQFGKLGPDAYTVNQRALDTRQRFWDADLDLRPGKRVRPFFSVGRNTGDGPGVSPIVLDENNYAASTRIDYGYTQYRGGVHVELDTLHLSLEQGGAKYHDDTRLALDTSSTGNREATYLGRQLTLDSARRLYGVTGDNIYSSAELTWSPLTWVDFTGQYFYARPRSYVQIAETDQGTLFWLDTVRFLSGQQTLSTGASNQPRTSGGFHIEVRPFARLRILESWQTDRTHVAGSAAILYTLNGTTNLPVVNDSTRIAFTQQDQRIQAFFDATKWLTLHGGHRYLWGDAQTRRTGLSTGGPFETGYLDRHSALAGLVLRPLPKLSINADTEVARGNHTYFRMSLLNYEQLRFRARYQLSPSWQWSARYTRLRNDNPTPTIGLRNLAQQSGATLQWTRKAFSIMGDYSRSTFWNDLEYFDPQTYERLRSYYQDNAHTATLAADFRLPHAHGGVLTVGGSLLRTSGSRPTRYYQPLARLLLPVHTGAQFLAEWRNVSLGQSAAVYEAFGVQQFTIGLRIGR